MKPCYVCGRRASLLPLRSKSVKVCDDCADRWDLERVIHVESVEAPSFTFDMDAKDYSSGLRWEPKPFGVDGSAYPLWGISKP